MPTGSEAFLELPIALGSGPATGPTLKTALCHIRTLVGRRINNGSLLSEPMSRHRQAGFESRLVPDLPLPFIPTLIGLRAFVLVSSRVWWEAATNTRLAPGEAH